MKINTVALIGLGAMGSFFAPRLHARLGNNFRVIAGGERKKRLESRGVTINGVNYRFKITAPDLMDIPFNPGVSTDRIKQIPILFWAGTYTKYFRMMAKFFLRGARGR